MTAFGGALTDPTKIMGSRIAAYLIDLALGVGLVLLVFFGVDGDRFVTQEYSTTFEAQQVCTTVNQRSTTGGRNGLCFVSGTTARVMAGDDLDAAETHAALVWFGFGFANYVLLSALAGGTLGKLLFGLRVVTARGARAGVGRNLVRWLLLIVDQACCFLPGLLTSFNTKGHRRVGDLVGGTYVVHRSAEGALLHIPGHLTVLNRQDPYVAAAAPPKPTATTATTAMQTAMAPGDGIDAPVFDASRNTYVRYDQASGTWFQWDERTRTWIPAQQ
jgi:hypothetical protein